jgi:hypothetical protein
VGKFNQRCFRTFLDPLSPNLSSALPPKIYFYPNPDLLSLIVRNCTCLQKFSKLFGIVCHFLHWVRFLPWSPVWRNEWMNLVERANASTAWMSPLWMQYSVIPFLWPRWFLWPKKSSERILGAMSLACYGHDWGHCVQFLKILERDWPKTWPAMGRFVSSSQAPQHNPTFVCAFLIARTLIKSSKNWHK